MSVSNLYTTLEAVRTFNQDDDMSEDLVITLIAGVSRAIDRYCRRVFYTTEEVRYYDFTSPHMLRLRDDLLSLSEVTTNAGQTLDADNFVLEPRIGPPYARVQLRDGLGVTLAYTTSTIEAIGLDGVWGYKTALPDDIELACKAWVSDIYAQSDSRGMESVSGNGVRASLSKIAEGPPPDVKGWLDHHRKPSRVIGLGSA